MTERGRRIRVLLVQNSADEATLVELLLARSRLARFVVARVETNRAASEPLSAEAVDVALVDADTPRGLEALGLLRSENPNLPVVVVTGEQDDEVRAFRIIELGADDLLPKTSVHFASVDQVLLVACVRSRAHAQLRSIVTANADGAVVVDATGAVLFGNHAAERLLGDGHRTLVGERLDWLATPSPEINEVTVRDAFGEEQVVELTLSELEWNGAPARLVSMRDVTERRRAADLEKRLLRADRLASLGQLAAGVAHEVNNPASFVQTNCMLALEALEELPDLLSRAEAEARAVSDPAADALRDAFEADAVAGRLAQVREMLSDAVEGIGRIATTVRNLGGFARLDADAVSEVDLAGLAESAYALVQNKVRHEARLVTDFMPVPPVAADEARLRQVVVNLLVNALQAIEDRPAAGHEITIGTRHEDQERVVLFVADTGCGIAEQDLSRVFDPFFTRKAPERGTGLGLSLSQEIVRSHGGGIHVQSELGRGSRFELWLPADTGFTTSSLPAPTSFDHLTARSARVLLVDDDDQVRRSVRRLLEPVHEVIEAAGGAHAVRLLREDSRYDVVVCDLEMPGVDGRSVYEAIRSLSEPLLERLVFISGGVLTRASREFLKDTRPALLTKPLCREHLLAKVAELAALTDPAPVS